MVMEVALHSLQRPTLAGAIRLLESARLPFADVTANRMNHFLCVGPVTAPRGMVGVELYGPDALLRSLVVVPELRSTGLGTSLVEHVERHAREQGARTVYLLTTTAEGFFRSRGYVAASRDSAPPSIRSTAEFAGLCPASSAFLSKRL
jgi:amino-acid N-acetyltransferase